MAATVFTESELSEGKAPGLTAGKPILLFEGPNRLGMGRDEILALITMSRPMADSS